MNIESDLLLYYSKAIESFQECIRDKDNEFLKEELSISLDDIRVTEKELKIIFTERTFDVYLIEVSLQLLSGSKEIGKYSYILNEKKEGVDDSLVFY